jgi:hypothetical protein
MEYVQPGACSWYWGDVADVNWDCLASVCGVVVTDPPWPSKSVSRASAYSTPSFSAIETLLRNIPVPSLLRSEGCGLGAWFPVVSSRCEVQSDT